MRAGRLFSLTALIVSLAFGPAHAAELDKYLPDNAEMVVVINVRQILASTVFKKSFQEPLTAALQNQRDDRPFLKFLNSEELRGITQVTVAFPPGPPERRALLIVRGRLDMTGAKEAAEAVAQTTPLMVKLHPADNGPLYEIQVDDPPVFTQFAAFPEKDVLVTSPTRDAVLDATAKGAGLKKSRVNKDLQTLLAKVDQQQSVWLVGRVPAQTKKDLAKRPQLKAFADKMESFSGGMNFADGIKAEFHLQMSDAQAATDLGQMLEVGKNLANLYLNNSPELKEYAPVLAEVLNSIQVKRQDTRLGIEVAISAEVIEKGMKR